MCYGACEYGRENWQGECKTPGNRPCSKGYGEREARKELYAEWAEERRWLREEREKEEASNF